MTLIAGPHVVETALGDTPAHPSTVSCEAAADYLVLEHRPAEPGLGPRRGARAHHRPRPAAEPPARPRPRRDHRRGTLPSEQVAGHRRRPPLRAGPRPEPATPAGSRGPPGRPAPPPGRNSVDLGPAELVDSFANGWPVGRGRPGRARGHRDRRHPRLHRHLHWAPRARSGWPWPSRPSPPVSAWWSGSARDRGGGSAWAAAGRGRSRPPRQGRTEPVEPETPVPEPVPFADPVSADDAPRPWPCRSPTVGAARPGGRWPWSPSSPGGWRWPSPRR